MVTPKGWRETDVVLTGHSSDDGYLPSSLYSLRRRDGDATYTYVYRKGSVIHSEILMEY